MGKKPQVNNRMRLMYGIGPHIPATSQHDAPPQTCGDVLRRRGRGGASGAVVPGWLPRKIYLV